MKEERDIDTLQSWVQVGGFPAQPEEEAWGLLIELIDPCQYATPLIVVSSDFCSAIPLFPFLSFLL